MGTALQVDEDMDEMGGQVVGNLLEDRGLADPALAVYDQDMVDKPSTQVLLNPVEYILSTEEHARFYNRGSCDVWIEKIVHRSIFFLTRGTSLSLCCLLIIQRESAIDSPQGGL